MLLDTVLDLHQRIVSPDAHHAPIPSTLTASEITPSMAVRTPCSSTAFIPAVSMHIQSPVPNQTCTSSPVLLVSPLPTIATILSPITTMNSVTNTETTQDEIAASNKANEEGTKEIEEDVVVDALVVGDTAALDPSIDSIVQQQAMEEEQQHKLQQPSQQTAKGQEEKQEARIKQVKITTIVWNEEEGNLSSTPLGHFSPSTEQQRLQQQNNNNVQVINNQETLDQMCQYRSQSLSPAASNTTAAGSDADRNQQQQLMGVKRPRRNLNFTRVGGDILHRHSSHSSICSSGTEGDDPKPRDQQQEKTCDIDETADEEDRAAVYHGFNNTDGPIQSSASRYAILLQKHARRVITYKRYKYYQKIIADFHTKRKESDLAHIVDLSFELLDNGKHLAKVQTVKVLLERIREEMMNNWLEEYKVGPCFFDDHRFSYYCCIMFRKIAV